MAAPQSERPQRRHRGGTACCLLWLLWLIWPISGMGAVAGPELAALQQRAVSQGSVRVIIQLAMDVRPSAGMSRQQAARRFSDIARMQAEVVTRLGVAGPREVRRFRRNPFMVFHADAAGLDRLAALPQIIGIHQDMPEPPVLLSSTALIGAPVAWGRGFDGTGQVVVVLDTGTQLDHPFFLAAGKVVAEACFSSNDPFNEATSLCPDQAEFSVAPGSGDACPLDIDGCDHGTHVAGIAVGNDGAGPNFGVARGAGLIPIQVFSEFADGPFGSDALSFPSDQISALEHVLDLAETWPIAAVNMSLGGGQFFNQASCDAANPARTAAIDDLRAAGIAVVIASGNNGFKTAMNAPGCISSAISIGATTDADLVADFSNIAPFISFLAPGSDITSAQVGGGLRVASGTSMATPHVAGAWAVLRQAAPELTLDELFTAVRDTAVLIDDQRPGGTITGMRRIQLDQALTAVLPLMGEFSSSPLAGTTLAFGPVLQGTVSSPQVIQVTNDGAFDMALQCQLKGVNRTDFNIGQCPGFVTNGGNGEISITCQPLTMGPLDAVLELTTSDPDAANVTFSLSCTGGEQVMFLNGFEDDN